VFDIYYGCASLCYMDNEMLDKLESEIERNRNRGIAAINELRAYNKSLSETDSKLLPAASQRRKPTSEIAEEIIKESKGDFEIATICKEMASRTRREPSYHTPRIVSQVINKLRQRNPPEVLTVVDGKGSRSGVYKCVKK
jgi:hypothetical protein